MRNASVDIHIEELVLDGLAENDSGRIGEAVYAELKSQLGVDAEAVSVEVADAIHRELRR